MTGSATASAIAGVAGMAIIGCAASAPPPQRILARPPIAVQEPRPKDDSANTKAAAPVDPPVLEAPAQETPKPPDVIAPPQPIITIELPYKLGERPPASADEENERARWNQGGRGAGEFTAPERHPLPRVIVDIVKVKGPHKAASIQRIARASLWGKIIECYRLGAYKDQSLKGKTTIRFQVSRAGKASRSASTTSTLPDKEVVRCLARQINTLELERAKAGSSVTATIQVFPGDDPMPPPASAIKPGSGVISPAEVERAVRAASPRIEACYRAALGALPELWGRIGARLHITPSGKVDEAFEAESRFPEESVTRCVLRELLGMDLPKPSGGDVRILVPIRLSPGKRHE
ncbi:MAG: AgmX/PglI C-terminal domain-containing protein [Polyangiaceae bacterium]|nr:AgmX/PglI C-terminal domain-containing protein [Polyangiaceae bacterium]